MAGCAFATWEVMAYCYGPAALFEQAFRNVRITIFIDDFGMECVGQTEAEVLEGFACEPPAAVDEVLWGTLEDSPTVDGLDHEGGEGEVDEHLAGL